jgi:hypothetical protein
MTDLLLIPAAITGSDIAAIVIAFSIGANARSKLPSRFARRALPGLTSPRCGEEWRNDYPTAGETNEHRLHAWVGDACEP